MFIQENVGVIPENVMKIVLFLYSRKINNHVRSLVCVSADRERHSERADY